VGVRFRASDAEGNTAIERKDLELRLVVVLRSSLGNVTTDCPSVDAISGLTTCSCTTPSRWFSTSKTGSVDATLQLGYAGTLRLEEAVGSVALQRSPVQGELEQSGMTLSLPSAPLYVGDSFTASVTASLVDVNYELMAWTISLGYNAEVLSLQDHSRYEDAIWGDAIVTQQAGSLRMIVLKPRCAPDCESLVSGSGIPIATATFTVQSGSEGTHPSAVWLRVVSMSNFGNSIFVEGQDALVLDGRDGGSANGQVVGASRVSRVSLLVRRGCDSKSGSVAADVDDEISFSADDTEAGIESFGRDGAKEGSKRTAATEAMRSERLARARERLSAERARRKIALAKTETQRDAAWTKGRKGN